MNSWITMSALWKIVVIGLLAGAGLPAVFAVGLRALTPQPRSTTTGTVSTAAAPDHAGPMGKLIAVLCFATVLAAMGWGIYSIVHNS